MINSIDNSPRHTIVTNKLIEKIEKMEIGEKLDSERDLCVEFDVSRTTIRHSLESLKISGYIEKIHGKGNFVTRPNKTKENLENYYSFTEQTISRNMKPSVKILSFNIKIPNNAIRKRMNLPAGERVIKIKRLRLADDIPMLYEITYLPEAIFKDLTKVKLEEESLYHIFENDYKVKIVKVDEQISAVNLSSKEAYFLDTKENASCLRIKRYSYDNVNRIVELTYTFAHPEHFIYRRSYEV